MMSDFDWYTVTIHAAWLPTCVVYIDTSALQLAPAAAELTELGGNDWNIMPGSLLSVQAFEQEHRSISRMDVEQAVHVSAPVDRVPVTRQTARGWERAKLSQRAEWTTVTLTSM